MRQGWWKINNYEKMKKWLKMADFNPLKCTFIDFMYTCGPKLFTNLTSKILLWLGKLSMVVFK